MNPLFLWPWPTVAPWLRVHIIISHSAPHHPLSLSSPSLSPSIALNVRLVHLSYVQVLIYTLRSNLNGATTASTKTFLTALVLNSAIASIEIAAFTIVWRYFRLIYEPRSLSVFETCACPLILQTPLLTFLQEETAAIISSLFWVARFCLQGGLSHDQIF